MGKEDPERTPLQSGKTYEASNSINSDRITNSNEVGRHGGDSLYNGSLAHIEPRSELDTFPIAQNSSSPTSNSWDSQQALQEIIQRTASAFIDVAQNPTTISVKEADKRATEYRHKIPSTTVKTNQFNILSLPTVTSTIGLAFEHLDNLVAHKEFIQICAYSIYAAAEQMKIVEKESLINPLPQIDLV